MRIFITFICFALVLIRFSFRYQVLAADPIIKLYSINDYYIAGSAYDPDCPHTPIEVHAYHDRNEAGVVCHAAYTCPWPNVCSLEGTGFWCLYRHPVDSFSIPHNVNIAAINKCDGGNNVWADKSSAFIGKYLTREGSTIFVDKPNYRVGISKRFGASVVEYYNKRVDPTVNLIHPDPGAAFQSALFGKDKIPGSTDCFGRGNLEYNPTQAGSHCGHPNGSDALLIESSNNYLKFLVHFKNFFYPMNSLNSYPYQDYDDVYGYVTYFFENDYIRIDYKLWKTTDKVYGISGQQIPIGFFLHLTRFTYKNNGLIVNSDASYNSSRSYKIDNNLDGRWVTLEGSPNGASPGNFLTLAFYNKPYKGSCQRRIFQMDYLPNGDFQSAVQNNVTFQVEKGYFIEFQSYIFPFKYDELLPSTGKKLALMIDTYANRGGLMPEWECNMPQFISDLNSDGKVDIFDYNILVTNFGKTGDAGWIPADINKDGKVDIFDYNILVSEFGKKA